MPVDSLSGFMQYSGLGCSFCLHLSCFFSVVAAVIVVVVAAVVEVVVVVAVCSFTDSFNGLL